MTPANKIIKMARETNSDKRWAMLKGQFRKLIGESVQSWSVFTSAMREFERLAPSPRSRKGR